MGGPIIYRYCCWGDGTSFRAKKRSIQRLEKGENTPRGDTLDRLSKVFEVPKEMLLKGKQIDSLIYLIILSLSPLVFLINPMMGVVLPFLLWLFMRRRIRKVDTISRQVLNFQISWVLVYYVITIAIIAPRTP